MTPEQIFTVARDVVMLTVTALVFYWGRERKQTADAIDKRLNTLHDEMAERFKTREEVVRGMFELRDLRLKSIEARMDGAGQKSSDLSDHVQKVIGRLDRLPDELRDRFAATERIDDFIKETRADRIAMWARLEDLERRRRGERRAQ